MSKFFSVLLYLSIHNYFDGPIKLFSDLYIDKFLSTNSAKPFFFFQNEGMSECIKIVERIKKRINCINSKHNQKKILREKKNKNTNNNNQKK